MNNFSIGITTFDKRFETYFCPLLSQIKSSRPDIEVICTINGITNAGFPQNYRREFLNFISDYDFVYPTFFPQFRSLSKLWNHCLLTSSNDLVLVLNDDVGLHPGFFDYLSQIDESESFTINGSWSHFMANRREIDEVGWFDERFLGIGNEDGDMSWRYNKTLGKRFKNYQLPGVVNLSPQTGGQLENQRELHWQGSITRYSSFNHYFFREKYEVDPNGFSDGWTEGGNKLIQKLDDINAHPTESFFWDRAKEL